MVVKGTQGAVTDVKGKFTIKAKPSDSLQISYLGYKTETLNVGSRTNFTVRMEKDSSTDIDEIVVIGYGQVAKKDLTGSVATVKMNDIKDVPVLSVDNALQGRIAGADFMSTTGEPGATTTIRIRGTRSINASNEPLIVVDGVMDAIHDLNDINSDDIASISVLKDASSTAIYGSRGANGVILDTRTDPDSPPIYPPAGMGDTTTGITLLSGVLAALLAARETGVGDYVMTSLYGTGNFVTAGFATNCNYGYEWPREAHTMSPLGQGYKCRDGRYIYVFVNDYTNVWPKFAKALRLPEEVVTDPRFTTKESTTIIANRSALVDIIREYALQRDAQDILDELVAYDVPSCILNQYKDRFSGEWLEQSVSNGYLIEHTYPSGNKAYLAQMPIYFDSLGVQDLYAQHRALGADNEAIEKEFGDGE